MQDKDIQGVAAAPAEDAEDRAVCVDPGEAGLFRLPIGLRAPLGASVTLLEATTPVKLPAKRTGRQPARRVEIPEFQHVPGMHRPD